MKRRYPCMYLLEKKFRSKNVVNINLFSLLSYFRINEWTIHKMCNKEREREWVSGERIGVRTSSNDCQRSLNWEVSRSRLVSRVQRCGRSAPRMTEVAFDEVGLVRRVGELGTRGADASWRNPTDEGRKYLRRGVGEQDWGYRVKSRSS